MYWNKRKGSYIIAQVRLTLTWDVLKYLKGRCGVKSAPWLTLTWDVLKYI